MTPTDETRFHALKFALQTPGVASPATVLVLANDYHRFLTGAADDAPEASITEREDGITEITCAIVAASTDLDTMVTESIETAEAVVAELAHDMASVGVTEAYQFGASIITGEDAETLKAFEDAQIASLLSVPDDGFTDFVLEQDATLKVEVVGWDMNEPEPTFEYIAAAVEEIASPPPPAEEDPSDEPELTTEQVERYEDTLRAADRVAVAPKEPEPEVKPAKAAWVDYVS